MDFVTAKKIDEHLKEIVMHANEALFIANNSGDDTLKKHAQLTLAAAIADIDLQLWEFIYSQHPSLRPPDMIAIRQPDS